MIYYCEVEDIDQPRFPGYMVEKNSSKEAVDFFKQKWKNRLEIVYDETYKIVYEKSED